LWGDIMLPVCSGAMEFGTYSFLSLI